MYFYKLFKSSAIYFIMIQFRDILKLKKKNELTVLLHTLWYICNTSIEIVNIPHVHILSLSKTKPLVVPISNDCDVLTL